MLKRLSFLLILQLLAIIIFCLGFFPQKNVLKGNADFYFDNNLQTNSKPAFNKLILVVIDALRSDFIFDKNNSKFEFVHSKLNSGEAWGYTAYSNPPTVTLPRLKGITTGSTPNFLDAILNVAEDDSSSSIRDQDSWLTQLHEKANHRIRFFGDDTWLKLFSPAEEIFDVWEGTNSFFVSDFEQVDLNVTRHIPQQLNEMEQWDTLILHYLGLDHIGHKGGAHSKFMPNKQIEMDSIIKTLYEKINDETLLVVMGDHGMNEVGNHGGSSAGETHAGLLFMSPKLQKIKSENNDNLQYPLRTPLNGDNEPTFEYGKQIQQIDLVPTISTLFNVPIPKNSVGIIIPEFLPFLEKHLISTKVLENYRQLAILADETQTSNENFSLNETYYKMKTIQDKLTRSATNYNYQNITIGYILLAVITILCSVLLVQQLKISKSLGVLLLISFALGFSTFGSSFVEEEHQLWWWFITGSVAITGIFKARNTRTYISLLLIFISVRLIRGWNNTGQKTVYHYVIGNLLRENTKIQWYLNVLTLVAVSLASGNYSLIVENVVLSVLTLAYKLNWALVNKEAVPVEFVQFTRKIMSIATDADVDQFELSLVPLALIFYKLLAALLVTKVIFVLLKIYKPKVFLRGITDQIIILLIFLSPSTNIPLYLIFEIIKYGMSHILKDEYDSNVYLISLSSLVLQNFTFFQFGGTNSIATIDLSNAYHGISSDYNIYVVGCLMTISNFAPAIYWAIYQWDLLYLDIPLRRIKWDNFSKSKLPILFYQCVVGCCLLAACVALRYHLFIWSVFSPKLCYYVFWNIFMGVIIGWIFEGIIVSLI